MEVNLCLSSSLLENSIQTINFHIYTAIYLCLYMYMHTRSLIVHSFIWFYETVMAVLELIL